MCGAEGGAGAVTRSTAAERVRGSAGSDGAAGAVRPPVAGRAGRRAGAGPAALAAARYRPPRVRPQGRRPGARDAHAEQAQPAQRVRRAGELEGRRARWGGRGSRGAGGARAERERVGAALRRADLAPCPLLGRRGLPRGPGRGSGGPGAPARPLPVWGRRGRAGPGARPRVALRQAVRVSRAGPGGGGCGRGGGCVRRRWRAPGRAAGGGNGGFGGVLVVTPGAVRRTARFEKSWSFVLGFYWKSRRFLPSSAPGWFLVFE